MILRIIYTFLVGIFLAIFIGVGISAFYESPKYPEMPSTLKYCTAEVKDVKQYVEFKNQAEAFDKLEKSFMVQEKIYNRNVAIIAIIAASALVIVSLTLLRKILLIADGILLGGVFTLIYSVIRGFGAEDTKFQFLVVSVGLIITLTLGYVKFIKPAKER
ncbi:MAG: hypothetical protein Q7T54_02960 [Candidatus Levybacteria bacterium]|nr:hypothetical protein [Candidatus Levybacteria bacterium]